MTDSSKPLSTPSRSPLWLTILKGILVLTLFALLLMPAALQHWAEEETEFLTPIHLTNDPDFAPTDESISEEAARLAREIDALTSINLADYSELSIGTESQISHPADSSPSESRSIQTTADSLFHKLYRLKFKSLHNLPEAELLMDLFESTIDETNAAHTHFLGQAYWQGWNRPQSPETAFLWFQQSHAYGNPRAVLPLISCHAFGIGTPRDPETATSLRRELITSFYSPSQIRRIDQILAASRKTPPLFTEIPERGQVPFAQIKPIFPLQLRKQGITGQAVMTFQVDAQGFTRNIKPAFFTHPEFAHAATEALTFWRVASRIDPNTGLSEDISVPIIFNITDDEEPPGN